MTTPERLIYVSSFDYPARYAHALHALLMSRAFYKKFGENFLFFVNTDKDGTLAQLPHRLLFGSLGRRIKLWGLRRLFIPLPLLLFFATHPAWRGSTTAVFTNDPGLIPILVFLKRLFKYSFIFESHGTLALHEERLLGIFADRVIFLTPFLEEEALLRTPALKGRTHMIGNATDVPAFEKISGDPASFREALSLPEGFVIGYVGRFEPLGEDKGLGFLIAATEHIPEATLLLVGGSRDEIARYRAYIAEKSANDRVYLVPHVTPSLVPAYIKACDILAYVPPAGSAFFAKETSPMKLFEYMASRRPMIVSDLPTTRAILGEEDAFFIPPGNEEAFVEAVRLIRAHPIEVLRKTTHAFAKVASNTWNTRVERILT